VTYFNTAWTAGGVRIPIWCLSSQRSVQTLLRRKHPEDRPSSFTDANTNQDGFTLGPHSSRIRHIRRYSHPELPPPLCLFPSYPMLSLLHFMGAQLLTPFAYSAGGFCTEGLLHSTHSQVWVGRIRAHCALRDSPAYRPSNPLVDLHTFDKPAITQKNSRRVWRRSGKPGHLKRIRRSVCQDPTIVYEGYVTRRIKCYMTDNRGLMLLRGVSSKRPLVTPHEEARQVEPHPAPREVSFAPLSQIL